MRQDRVLKLIERIYDAATEAAAWNAVLEDLLALTGGTGADLAAFNLRTARASIQVSVGSMNDDFKRDYQQVEHIDPFLIKAKDRRLFRTGLIGIGEQLVPLRELERTEFYSAFGRRHEYIGGIAAVLAADKESVAAIGISRHRKRQIGSREVRLLRTLMPHLQRAWHMHLRLAEAEHQHASFTETLSRLAPPVVIVGGAGAVLFANDAAREVLAAQDGLSLSDGTLRGASSQDTSALRSLIQSAVTTAASESLNGGGVLELGRPSGRRGLRVIVSPLPANERLAVAEPRALLFVIDPEHAREPDASLLRRAYDLTPAETQVGILLMQDKSVKEIGEGLRVSVHTVRFHLRQLFAKTGTSRQGALIRLLSGAAQIRRA